MDNRTILHGDVLDKLKEIPDDSINCIITSPPYWGLRKFITTNMVVNILRNKKGQITKGMRLSKNTEFKKGQHWRSKKAFWDRDTLYNLYVSKQMSTTDISKKYKTTPNNILYFLHKLKIKTRNTSQTRKIKHWGLSGKNNPMHGKYGKDNPNWNGGHSGERQCAYARSFWKEIKKLVLKRDNYKCVQCGNVNKLVVHHILHWSRYPKYRFTESNLMTLCVECHKTMHSKRRR